MSWSTASSRVAQLVQIRTAVRPSSTFSQKEKTYFSSSRRSCSSGKMKNCWLVGEGA